MLIGIIVEKTLCTMKIMHFYHCMFLFNRIFNANKLKLKNLFQFYNSMLIRIIVGKIYTMIPFSLYWKLWLKRFIQLVENLYISFFIKIFMSKFFSEVSLLTALMYYNIEIKFFWGKLPPSWFLNWNYNWKYTYKHIMIENMLTIIQLWHSTCQNLKLHVFYNPNTNW